MRSRSPTNAITASDLTTTNITRDRSRPALQALLGHPRTRALPRRAASCHAQELDVLVVTIDDSEAVPFLLWVLPALEAVRERKHSGRKRAQRWAHVPAGEARAVLQGALSLRTFGIPGQEFPYRRSVFTLANTKNPLQYSLERVFHPHS